MFRLLHRHKTAGIRSFTLLVALMAGLPAHASALPPVVTEEFILPSGLRVVLHPVPDAPRVVVNLWYGVGSAAERPGSTGLAHLFEHLMFEGSAHVPEGAFDTWLEAVGGENNGSTQEDRTNYWIEVPPGALPLALFLESDRMGYLLDTLTPERVEGQRDVVKNELRQNYENRPYGRAHLLLPGALWPEGHPYSWPVIGSLADLTRVQPPEVVEFFRCNYAPDGASLVIAGPIDVARVREQVTHWFSDVRAPTGGCSTGPATQHPPPPSTTPLTASKRLVVEDRVELPQLTVAWRSAAAFQPGDAALDVAALLLAQGKQSRLYRRLVHDQQIAQSVHAYQDSRKAGGAFVVEVMGSPNQALSGISDAIDEEIARLVDEPIPDREWQRAHNRIEADFVDAFEQLGGFGGRADSLNRYLHFLGTPDGFERDLRRYQALRPADVQQALGRLRQGGNVAISTVPAGRRDLALAPLPAAAVVDTIARATPPGVVDTTLAAPELAQRVVEAAHEAPPGLRGVTSAPAPAAPDRRRAPSLLADPPHPVPMPVRFALPNGLTVLFVERHAAPLVDAALVVRKGAADEPEDRPGLAALTAEMLTEGAGELDALGFAEAVEFLGARLDSGAGFHATRLSLHTPSTRLAAALPLLSDAVVRPRLAAADLSRVQALQAAAFEEERADPGALASAARARLLYPDHRYGRRVDGTPESVAAMTASELRAFHQQHYRPDDAYLVVVGDIDEAGLRALLAETLGRWQRPAHPPAPSRRMVPLPGPRETRWVIVDRPGATQSVISVAAPAPDDMTPWDADILVMNTLLGGSFSSRLNQNLREDKQYAYGAGSRFLHQHGAHAFTASASVASDVSAPALQEILRELTLIRSVVYDEEGHRARGFVARSFPGQFATGGDVADLLASVEHWHLRPEVLQDLPALVEQVSDRQLLAAARRVIDLSRLRIVVVGDRQRIEPSLEALGIGAPLLWDGADLW